MRDHLAHEPHGHCHHHVTASECTLCTYMALEKAFDTKLLDLIEEQQNETTALGSPQLAQPSDTHEKGRLP